MTSESANIPARGEIWLVRYRFYDVPATKFRPAVCIDWHAKCNEGIFCKITKHNPRENDEGDLFLSEWKNEGLLLPSTIRCTQIQLISDEAIYRQLGFLSDSDFMRVFTKLEKIHPLLFL